MQLHYSSCQFIHSILSLFCKSQINNQVALTSNRIKPFLKSIFLRKELQTYSVCDSSAPAGCLHFDKMSKCLTVLKCSKYKTIYTWRAYQNHRLQIAHYYKTAQWVTDWREKCGRETWFIQRSKTLPNIECRVV